MSYNETESKLDLRKIETKWKLRWSTENLFVADPNYNNTKKYFITVAFPYPNSPQHIGHGRTYTLADVHARYMRMKGNNVLFPMAFHYTGTPILAMSKRVMSGDEDLINTFKNLYNVPEDIIKTFSNPEKIARYFHKEIKLGMQEMGYSIDWTREFTTIDELYSKFITWQFKTLQQKGLAAPLHSASAHRPVRAHRAGSFALRVDSDAGLRRLNSGRYEHECTTRGQCASLDASSTYAEAVRVSAALGVASEPEYPRSSARDSAG
jgi:leucyl-tRNA synthetase